jgi:primary-amine oxidase
MTIPTPPTSPHPLAPLTKEEFQTARDTVVKCFSNDVSLFFRGIWVEEPKKSELVPYLESEHLGNITEQTVRPVRLARLQYDVIKDGVHEYTQSLVDVVTGKEVQREVAKPSQQTSYSP